MTKVLISLIFTFISLELFSQGQIRFDNDSKKIKGALVLTPNSTIASGQQQVVTTFPGGDPLINRNEWVRKGSSQMRGLVKDAAVFLEWWTLLGDPVERYLFKWISSGYFEVSFIDNGNYVTQSIYRSNLGKYPDLLKWFDSLHPNNVNMEINFSNGQISNQDYYDFRRKYNILEDLGSAGYNTDYRTEMNGANWLFATSGKSPPLVVPQIPLGGWTGFLGLRSDLSSEKEKRLIELFKLGNGVNINSFRITAIDWDIEGMVQLAKLFIKYEKGELSPKEIANAGESIDRSTQNDDFWNEPEIVLSDLEIYRDPSNNKMGLKAKYGKQAYPAVYGDLTEVKKGFFFGRRDNAIYAINSLGKEIASVGKGFRFLKGDYIYKEIEDSYDDSCNGLYYEIYEVYRLIGSQFVKQELLHSIKSIDYLTVNSGRTPTREEREAAERKDIRRTKECKEKFNSYFQSKGAASFDSFVKNIVEYKQ